MSTALMFARQWADSLAQGRSPEEADQIAVSRHRLPRTHHRARPWIPAPPDAPAGKLAFVDRAIKRLIDLSATWEKDELVSGAARKGASISPIPPFDAAVENICLLVQPRDPKMTPSTRPILRHPRTCENQPRRSNISNDSRDPRRRLPTNRRRTGRGRRNRL
jgi:hypothetical protein